MTAGTAKKAKGGATMSDLISREALVRKMNERYCKIDNGRAFKGIKIPVVDGVRMHEIECCIGMIQCEDVIEAEPVRHGRWICPDYDFSDYWKCSACNEEFYFEYDPSEGLCHYCPNCGAKMDGGEGRCLGN